MEDVTINYTQYALMQASPMLYLKPQSLVNMALINDEE